MTDQTLTPNAQKWRNSGTLLRYKDQHVFAKTEGTGPALLFIHGYPTCSYDWNRVWPLLAPHFRLVAIDLLGMGLSNKPKDFAYRIADHADLQEWIITLLGLDRVILVAHDLGVSIAQEMLARRREGRNLAPIESVVLINGGVFPEIYQARFILRLLSSPIGKLIGTRMSRDKFEQSLDPLFGPEFKPSAELLDDLWTMLVWHDGLQVTHIISRFWKERLALRKRLAAPVMECQVPMRFINGLLDPNSGKHMADRYRQLVPYADIHGLETVGHWPQLEVPKVVATSILNFLGWATDLPDRH